MKYILITFLFNFIFCVYHKKLILPDDKEFTILQLTDLHYGEHINKDINSTLLIAKLINYTNPDLVIITGDAVSGYAWDSINNTFYKECWDLWTKSINVPYAYVLGNHDDQADMSRGQIIDLDRTHEYSLMKSSLGITGASNYYIPLYSENGDPITILWMFDTNDEGCLGMSDSWGCFEDDQIKWYEEESEKLKSNLTYSPKGLAFFHIPIPEYLTMHNWRPSYGNRNEGISCPRRNTDLFKSFLKVGNIIGTFCGHDHDNDNGGYLYNIELVYGRKTGYGGYGPSFFQRGGRVIKIKKTGVRDFSYSHFVIQEDGSKVDNGNPSWKGWYDYVSRCSS